MRSRRGTACAEGKLQKTQWFHAEIRGNLRRGFADTCWRLRVARGSVAKPQEPRSRSAPASIGKYKGRFFRRTQAPILMPASACPSLGRLFDFDLGQLNRNVVLRTLVIQVSDDCQRDDQRRDNQGCHWFHPIHISRVAARVKPWIAGFDGVAGPRDCRRDAREKLL